MGRLVELADFSFFLALTSSPLDNKSRLSLSNLFVRLVLLFARSPLIILGDLQMTTTILIRIYVINTPRIKIGTVVSSEYWKNSNKTYPFKTPIKLSIEDNICWSTGCLFSQNRPRLETTIKRSTKIPMKKPNRLFFLVFCSFFSII